MCLSAQTDFEVGLRFWPRLFVFHVSTVEKTVEEFSMSLI